MEDPMTEPTTSIVSTQSIAAGSARFSDVRIAAIVQAAYLLDLARR
jgi:hypothetical protein